MLKNISRLLLCLGVSLGMCLAQAGETTNRIGITMVDIPAGSFLMGSCKQTGDEAERIAKENKKRTFLGQPLLSTSLKCGSPDPDAGDNETPQHWVSIKKFQMGKTEVTLGQFKQFIAAAGRTDLVNDDFMKYNRFGDDAPVVMVSWHDAQDFVKWLNRIDGGGYRLPSEAEWEYACRAGQNTTYCGSNSINDVAWWDKNSEKHQQPVAMKQPNNFGLYDMSGNVWEWVLDCWNNSYNGAPNNDSAWMSGKCRYHVQRGGSWDDDSGASRAAFRILNAPGILSYDGFRLARTR